MFETATLMYFNELYIWIESMGIFKNFKYFCIFKLDDNPIMIIFLIIILFWYKFNIDIPIVLFAI